MAFYTTIRTRPEKNPSLTGRGPVRQHQLAGIALAALALLALPGELRPEGTTARVTGRATSRARTGFNAPLSFDVGPDWLVPYTVAVGDLNGDGIPDLVVGNQQGTTVSVLLGKGDGTFQPAVAYTSGNGPISVTMADVNGDGIRDLAVTNIDGNTVSVLLGMGDGTFQAAVPYAAGIAPRTVAVADLNGDGIPDLAVANEGTAPNYTDGCISVLLGKGNGTFAPAVNYATPDRPTAVVVADFSRDGILDLAVTNYVDAGSVSMLLGKGDGTFQIGASSPAGAA